MNLARTVTLAVLLATACAVPDVTRAHDADDTEPGLQPHAVGPYLVGDAVRSDPAADTTTTAFELTVPAGSRSVGHVTVRLPQCRLAHEFVAISDGGRVESKDPSTGVPGPVIKWDAEQPAGSTRSYSFTVRGAFAADESMLALKGGRDTYGSSQQVAGCRPVTSRTPAPEASPTPREHCGADATTECDVPFPPFIGDFAPAPFAVEVFAQTIVLPEVQVLSAEADLNLNGRIEDSERIRLVPSVTLRTEGAVVAMRLSKTGGQPPVIRVRSVSPTNEGCVPDPEGDGRALSVANVPPDVMVAVDILTLGSSTEVKVPLTSSTTPTTLTIAAC